MHPEVKQLNDFLRDHHHARRFATYFVAAVGVVGVIGGALAAGFTLWPK